MRPRCQNAWSRPAYEYCTSNGRKCLECDLVSQLRAPCIECTRALACAVVHSVGSHPVFDGTLGSDRARSSSAQAAQWCTTGLRGLRSSFDGAYEARVLLIPPYEARMHTLRTSRMRPVCNRFVYDACSLLTAVLIPRRTSGFDTVVTHSLTQMWYFLSLSLSAGAGRDTVIPHSRCQLLQTWCHASAGCKTGVKRIADAEASVPIMTQRGRGGGGCRL